jgi:hypothetical protein
MRPMFALMALIALVASVNRTANATSSFPAEIQSHLQLSYLPPCNICHASASGGGPMTTAFGIAMQQRGLVAGNLASLDQALDRMAADGVDSNHNNVSDIQDLRNGIDPSDPGNLSLTGPTPEYGCAIVARRRSSNTALIWLIGAAVTATVIRQRRAPKRRIAGAPQRQCQPSGKI